MEYKDPSVKPLTIPKKMDGVVRQVVALFDKSKAEAEASRPNKTEGNLDAYFKVIEM